MRKYLLIISCSNRKNKDAGFLPAIERYTGAWYGVINKLKRERKFPVNLEIVIISAKYGFLKSNDLIEYYNLRMTQNQAKELNSIIINNFKSLFEERHYCEIFVNLGNDYIPAIKGLEKIVPQETKLLYAKGKVGERKSQMKKWILTIIA